MKNVADQRFAALPTLESVDGSDVTAQRERIVLGRLLLMPDAASHLDVLRYDDFASPGHQHIYAAIVAHTDTAVDIGAVLEDILTVRAVLALGDPAAYLSRLRTEGIDAVGDFRFHANRVREPADLRRIRNAMEIARRAADSGSRELAVNAVEEVAASIRRADGERSDDGRRVDLTDYLTGVRVAPEPSVGGMHDTNGSFLLYPGRWHTCVALTTAGKSWFALWHCVSEIRAGRRVAYAHFEESDPGGTLDRLRMVAPDLNNDHIRERFVWLDCTRAWNPSEWSRAVPRDTSLVILDGINAACGQHGWNVSEAMGVGEYRSLFVTPSTSRGMAVLSLGHPVKNRDRQGERHSYGASGWLDDVDGVSFRLEASTRSPIRMGHKGYSMLFVVKDRYSRVLELCDVEESREAGWFRLGMFKIDSRPERRNTAIWLDSVPESETVGGRSDEDRLADAVAKVLATMPGGRFASVRVLEDHLRAADVKFKTAILPAALIKLEARGVIDWPETGERKSRPGRLVDRDLLPGPVG